MFTPATLDFLRQLDANNDRDWFAAHREGYERDVKGAAGAVIDILATDLARQTGVAHEGKLFRVHRDVRFSKDKTPYNPHVHISITPTAQEGLNPVWMLGLSPDYFTLGAGTFTFDADGLARFRDLAAGPGGGDLADLLDRLAAGGVRLSEPELKRVPAPQDRDHPRASLLRRKGLAAWVDAAPQDGLGEDGLSRARNGFARLRPLYDLMRAV